MNMNTPSDKPSQRWPRLGVGLLLLACLLLAFLSYQQARTIRELRRQNDTLLLQVELQSESSSSAIVKTEARPAANDELTRLRAEVLRLRGQVGLLRNQAPHPPVEPAPSTPASPASEPPASGATQPGAGPAHPPLLATTVTPLGETVRYGYRQGTKVTIEGTSTIHDWTVEGSIIGGAFEVESTFVTDRSLKSVPSLRTKGVAPSVDVSIPVRSLKSKYTKMDEIMQEAMRMKDNPKILYRCSEMIVKGDVPPSGTPVKFDTKGELVIAGVTNQIDMEVTLERLENETIKFSAAKPLKMTAFRITPPSPSISGGLIKTGDDVTVRFEWLVGFRR